MNTAIKIAIGFALSLVGASVIHAKIHREPPDATSLAYCAPMAMTAPLFILNFGYYADLLYDEKRHKLILEGGKVDRSEIQSTSSLQAALISGALTALFWLPFFIPNIQKAKLNPKNI